MSNATDNLMLRGQRGKVGDQVILRTFKDGQTYMSNVHNYRDAVWTEKQEKNRQIFRRAVKHADRLLKDEKSLHYYQKKGRGAKTARSVAIGDYMIHHKLTADMSQFEGRNEGKMIFNMLHKFGGTSATVSVLDLYGNLIETGQAKLTKSELGWEYTLKTPTAGLKSGIVEVTICRGPVEFERTFNSRTGFQ